jgi:hypothetical protein
VNRTRGALAVVVCGGSLVTDTESSAERLESKTRRAREFRLVDPYIEARKLEHARLVQTIVTRGDRSGSFVVGPFAAVREMGLAELNQELARNGYSTIGARALFGIGSAWFGRSAFFGLTFEGAPNAIRSADGIEGNIGYLDFMLQGGPVFTIRPSTILYPYFGFGFGVVNVFAQTTDTARTPILSSLIPSLPKGFNVNSAMPIIELGLGSMLSVPFSSKPADRYGVAVGTEVGYSFSFAESDWRDGTAGRNPPSYSGPSSGVHGATVRVLLRYIYDGFDVRHDDHPMSSCRGRGCRVVCEDGFSDCDADPSNGCETEMGTVENCGACGDSCMVRHGLGVCGETKFPIVEYRGHHAPSLRDRECAVAACEPGFMNCNGRAGDGCETPTMIDPYNCGACGHLCTPLDHCVAGRCVPKNDTDDLR